MAEHGDARGPGRGDARGAALAWLATFRPRSPTQRTADYLRGALGAVLGIAVASWAGQLLDVGPDALPFIVAPIGATSVLLFAAPASPLAQPWAVVGGNIVSTLIGTASGRLIDNTTLAASVAVGAAIGAMMLLRCLHPPGGACALFVAVGAGVVRDQGFTFALFPVAVDTVFILLVAIAVNNLTGRRYPHAPETPSDAKRLGLQMADIRDAIARMDQGLDVLPDDVLALVREAEAHAVDRQIGRLQVHTVMERDVVSVLPFESVFRVRMIMSQQQVKAVPVLDDDRAVIGIVTIYDLFRLGLANVAPVSTVMSSPVTTIDEDAPVARLVALMTDRGLRHVPVVDASGHLAGIVTRSELIRVLNHALLSGRED